MRLQRRAPSGGERTAINKARFKAFPGGVFAFAAMFLILGISLRRFGHPPAEAVSFGAVVHQWPS